MDCILNSDELQAADIVHFNFGCDGCQMFPIVGVRYRCTECEDYDLCRNCFPDHEHEMEKFLHSIYSDNLGKFFGLYALLSKQADKFLIPSRRF